MYWSCNRVRAVWFCCHHIYLTPGFISHLDLSHTWIFNSDQHPLLLLSVCLSASALPSLLFPLSSHFNSHETTNGMRPVPDSFISAWASAFIWIFFFFWPETYYSYWCDSSEEYFNKHTQHMTEAYLQEMMLTTLMFIDSHSGASTHRHRYLI